LFAVEAERESDDARRRELQRELGELHRTRTNDSGGALRAFVSAGDWDRASELISAAEGPARLELAQLLFELAVADWASSGSGELGAQMGAGAADSCARRDLAQSVEDGRHAEVVEPAARGSLVVSAAAQQLERSGQHLLGRRTTRSRSRHLAIFEGRRTRSLRAP
jgi:hypothetical protein